MVGHSCRIIQELLSITLIQVQTKLFELFILHSVNLADDVIVHIGRLLRCRLNEIAHHEIVSLCSQSNLSYPKLSLPLPIGYCSSDLNHIANLE